MFQALADDNKKQRCQIIVSVWISNDQIIVSVWIPNDRIPIKLPELDWTWHWQAGT